MTFRNHEESHAHALQVLELLYQYSDFMESIDSLIDFGCGAGLDLEWWATRTTNDDLQTPLNIKCTGVDQLKSIPVSRKYANLIYLRQDFEEPIGVTEKQKFDVLWCHDAFQYAVNPIRTLSNWHAIASEGAMLCLIVPQTTNIVHKNHQMYQYSGCYYHHSLVSLIHMLAVSGWDCRAGFFQKMPNDPWLSAIVYKSQHSPMNPKTTTWYDLMEKQLLPESADECVNRLGYLSLQELTLPWLDHSVAWYGRQ